MILSTAIDLGAAVQALQSQGFAVNSLTLTDPSTLLVYNSDMTTRELTVGEQAVISGLPAPVTTYQDYASASSDFCANSVAIMANLDQVIAAANMTELQQMNAIQLQARILKRLVRLMRSMHNCL